MAVTPMSALLVLQRELGKSVIEEVPAEWKQTSDWAEEAGVSLSTATRIIKQGMRRGMVERRAFRVLRGDSLHARNIPHYRVIRGKK